MTLQIQRFTATRIRNKQDENYKWSVSYPPEYIKDHPIINSSIIPKLEKMTSAQIRGLLIDKGRFAIVNPDGVPYAYRLADTSRQLKTLFPKTQEGETVPNHGRLTSRKIVRRR